ncbi:thiol-disulfide isomerase [Corynebacterium lactis RW2-5]|uniref:Thiol-disulfide isomerase n=1 Tax=Corynebacterium lactis RW2-5 TaxID=1408189 RepID=A0A0K2GY56_9CORY|nr:thiol-disulfide isomerase [Corynebacterium lactis RW2-5]
MKVTGSRFSKVSSSRISAALAATALTLTLVSCGAGDSVGHDAVAIGGQFEFVSPGGQQVIDYAPADRKPVGKVFGESLEDPKKEISLDDFKDQIVVLNAWGQWCAPCRSESDDLQAVQEKMDAEGIGTILGINVRDNVRQAPIDFVKDNGITYPSIYDPAFVNAGALGGIPASVIPTTIILDKQHRPAKVFLREIDEKTLMDAVNKVKAEA